MATAKIGSTVTSRELPADYFKQVKAKFKELLDKKTKKLADEMANRAKEVIKKQAYKWAPLSPDYKAFKKKKGLDRRILIATKDYIENGIGSYVKGKTTFVGPLPGTHKPSGLPYEKLAEYLEYGTFNTDGSVKMPARRLWGPLKIEARKRSKVLKKELAKEVKDFEKKLRSKSKKKTKKV